MNFLNLNLILTTLSLKALVLVVLAFGMSSCGRDDSMEIAAGVNPDGTPSTTVKGDKGDKGEKGDPGVAGTPTSMNQWYDPITKKIWVMSTFNRASQPTDGCVSNDYRAPTKTETIAALSHGLKAAAQSLPNPAINIIVSVDSVPDYGYTIKIADGTMNVTGNGAEFCIQK